MERLLVEFEEHGNGTLPAVLIWNSGIMLWDGEEDLGRLRVRSFKKTWKGGRGCCQQSRNARNAKSVI